MTKKEQQAFDVWWRKNMTHLVTIYSKEIHLSLAVLEIAEIAWEEALNAKAEEKADKKREKRKV